MCLDLIADHSVFMTTWDCFLSVLTDVVGDGGGSGSSGGGDDGGWL